MLFTQVKCNGNASCAPRQGGGEGRKDQGAVFERRYGQGARGSIQRRLCARRAGRRLRQSSMIGVAEDYVPAKTASKRPGMPGGSPKQHGDRSLAHGHLCARQGLFRRRGRSWWKSRCNEGERVRAGAAEDRWSVGADANSVAYGGARPRRGRPIGTIFRRGGAGPISGSGRPGRKVWCA